LSVFCLRSIEVIAPKFSSYKKNLSQKQSKCPRQCCETVQNTHIRRVWSTFSSFCALAWTYLIFEKGSIYSEIKRFKTDRLKW